MVRVVVDGGRRVVCLLLLFSGSRLLRCGGEAGAGGAARGAGDAALIETSHIGGGIGKRLGCMSVFFLLHTGL
ncbi:hypothetical protein BDZ91DRAFT_746310, partial [Kalaharituber pfeilii]